MLKPTNFYNEKHSKLTELFWWFSGSNSALLRSLPSEKFKFQVIGAIVLSTALFATLTSTYALHFVYDDIRLAVLFGIFWGMIILNLDRFVLITIGKGKSIFIQFILAFPRLIIAVFIALLIAKPFELAIFEKEIEGELEYLMEIRNRASEARDKSNEYEYQIRKIENELKEEKAGKGISGKYGDGPVAGTIEEQLSRLKNEKEKVDEKKDKLFSEVEEHSFILGILERSINGRPNLPSNNPGLLTYLTILDSLTERYPVVYYTDLFLTLLLVLIEIMPVLAKIITARGTYDYAFDELIEVENNASDLEMSQLKEEQVVFYNMRKDTEEKFIENLFNAMAKARESKVNEVISIWNSQEDKSFDGLVKLLSSEFGEQVTQQMPSVEIKKEKARVKFPSINKSIKESNLNSPSMKSLIITSVVAASFWVVVMFLINWEIQDVDIKMGVIFGTAIGVIRWFLFFGEQKLKEMIRNKFIEKCTEYAALATVFIAVGILAKYAFGFVTTDVGQLATLFVSGGVGKAVSDRLVA